MKASAPLKIKINLNIKNLKKLYPNLTVLNFTHDTFFKKISDEVIEI